MLGLARLSSTRLRHPEGAALSKLRAPPFSARGRWRGARADGRAGARSGAARQEQRRPAPDMLYVVGLGLGDTKDITVKASRLAVRGVRLGCRTWALRARCTDNEGCARKVSYMMCTKSRQHRETATLFQVLLPGLLALQAALCAAQCSFWHALLQYSTLLHALHLLRPPLGQPGHAQRRRSPASGAPALEPEEAAPVVAPSQTSRQNA
jgi:hypothetical protein